MERSTNDKATMRAEIEDIVVIATGRVVTVPGLRAADGYLQVAGVNSIGLINVLEALGSRYGLHVSSNEDMDFLETVDSIAARVMVHQAAHERCA